MQKLPTVNVFEVALPVPDRLTAAAINDRFELKREAADRRPAVIAPSPSDNEAAYTVPNARSLAY